MRLAPSGHSIQTSKAQLSRRSIRNLDDLAMPESRVLIEVLIPETGRHLVQLLGVPEGVVAEDEDRARCDSVLAGIGRGSRQGCFHRQF